MRNKCSGLNNGRKVQKYFETKDRKFAKEIEAKTRTEIIEGSYAEKLISSKKTFEDMVEKFISECEPKVSVKMQLSYEESLEHLISYFGKTNLLSISPKMISKYKVLRKEDGASPASIDEELYTLSKVFSVAINEWERNVSLEIRNY